MKIEQLSPLSTSWKSGLSMKASSWSSVDDIDPLDGACRRRVFHYETLMAEFIMSGVWACHPLSTGWGTKSDQDGMNTLLSAVGSSLRYYRNKKYPRYAVSISAERVEVPR